MENDMKMIALGAKTKDTVVRECILEMKRIFGKVHQSANVMKQFLMH